MMLACIQQKKIRILLLREIFYRILAVLVSFILRPWIRITSLHQQVYSLSLPWRRKTTRKIRPWFVLIVRGHTIYLVWFQTLKWIKSYSLHSISHQFQLFVLGSLLIPLILRTYRIHRFSGRRRKRKSQLRKNEGAREKVRPVFLPFTRKLCPKPQPQRAAVTQYFQFKR